MLDEARGTVRSEAGIRSGSESSGGQGQVDADFGRDGVVGGEHLEAAFVEADVAEGDALAVGEVAGQAGRFTQSRQGAGGCGQEGLRPSSCCCDQVFSSLRFFFRSLP